MCTIPRRSHITKRELVGMVVLGESKMAFALLATCFKALSVYRHRTASFCAPNGALGYVPPYTFTSVEAGV